MLVAQERYDDAGSVWRQAIAITGAASRNQDGSSLVFDGYLERDRFGGVVLGGTRTDIPGADFDFDTGEEHSGSRSARIHIQWNAEPSRIRICIKKPWWFAPGTHYHFQGYMRTDENFDRKWNEIS